jgi:serine/threonine-protein kinase
LLGLALLPHKGKILVNVSDVWGAPIDRISVYVDGQSTPCSVAPCFLPYGTGTHEVKVVAEGFEVPATQAVVVRAGDAVAANFLLASAAASGIRVNGAQAGVKLFVDQVEQGPLPQLVHGLTPGDHTIRVAGSERYRPIERHVILERGKIEDIGTITLKVLRGSVTVSSETAGARVFISSGSDRRELVVLPISLDLDTARSWMLEGVKPGYLAWRQPISFDDGMAEKTYTIALEPAPAAVAVAPPPEPDSTATSSEQIEPPSPSPAPAAAPARRGANAGARGEAFLNINSIPPSTCTLDGRNLGSTPRLRVSVRPGSHTVKFRAAGNGPTKTISVSVKAGETKLATARLN